MTDETGIALARPSAPPLARFSLPSMSKPMSGASRSVRKRSSLEKPSRKGRRSLIPSSRCAVRMTTRTLFYVVSPCDHVPGEDL